MTFLSLLNVSECVKQLSVIYEDKLKISRMVMVLNNARHLNFIRLKKSVAQVVTNEYAQTPL